MGKRLTTEEFIEKARLVHGNKYNYSLVDYIGSQIKVKIICPDHGVFEQVPSSHLRGTRCQKCGFKSLSNTKSMDTKEFIERAKKINGNKYDYSKTEYIRSFKKVTITCYIHGDFKQRPAKHLVGYGCYKCGVLKVSESIKSTTEKFVQKAKQVHGDKYDYSLVDYIGNKRNVKIICSKHSVFEQKPDVHLSGAGCIKCVHDNIKENPSGWTITNWQKAGENSKRFDSFKVYVIKCWNNDEKFYKIGRTFNKTKIRFQSNDDMPYSYEIINEYIFDTAKEAFDKETELKRLHQEHKYLPRIKFGGMQECFTTLIDF